MIRFAKSQLTRGKPESSPIVRPVAAVADGAELVANGKPQYSSIQPDAQAITVPVKFSNQRLLPSVWPADPPVKPRNIFARQRFPFLRSLRENQ